MSYRGFNMSVRMLFAAFLVLLSSKVTSAQSRYPLDVFYNNLSDSCLELTYSYTTRVSGLDNKGNGTLRSQGLMWDMKGNGVEMYCDAKTVWVVDPSMKEVVIEPAAGEDSAQWLSNPAVIFARLKDLFDVSESLASKDSSSLVYVLHPKTSGDIDYCNIEILRSDASLRGATIALSDGTLIKIEVSSMKLTPKVSVKSFRPQNVFDSSWIVTDLR